MSEDKEYKDSFTIGTPSTGGSIKVYFDSDDSDTAIKKIKWAINIYLLLIEKNKK